MVKINYNKVRAPSGVSLIIHPIGDTHIGHECCDECFIKETLSGIPKTGEHRIILMGDLIDAGVKGSVGASVYENVLSPQQQVEKVIELFEPYKDQIDGMVMGNHEYRIFKDSGIDVCKIIADRLQIPYFKYSGMITYSMPHRAYNFKIMHGKCGGTVENALRKCKEMSFKSIADVYLMGHVHQCAYTVRGINFIDSRNEKIVEGKQYFVLTGHSLNYNESYAEQAGLEMSAKGFPIIELYATGRKKIRILVNYNEI